MQLRNLLWPSVTSDADVDYLMTQGFWICFVAAAMTLAVNIVWGGWFGILESTFFYLGGNGVRRRSMVAAISVFVAYAFGTLLVAKTPYAIPRILLCGPLLANVRAIWIASRWRRSDDSPPPLGDTFGDKLSDQVPAIIWPKTRFVFYVLAVLEMAALTWAWVWA